VISGKKERDSTPQGRTPLHLAQQFQTDLRAVKPRPAPSKRQMGRLNRFKKIGS